VRFAVRGKDPTNAVKAEATPNTEMMLISDVDLSLLKELHEFGSVQTIKDRRTDLYDVVTKKAAKRTKKAVVIEEEEDLPVVVLA